MIQFLNPLVLLGLAAGAIPFIIHFFSRFRAERREFSSLMLLTEISERQVRRLRMRRWLLLALRTLAVILLVLVPARPVVSGFFEAGPSQHLPAGVVFVFDNSASLGYVDGQGAVGDRLAGRMERIRSWLGSHDRYSILTAPEGFNIEESEDWLIPGGLMPSGAILRPGSRGGSLGDAIRAAGRLLAASDGAVTREGFIFSDCQRGFLGADSLGPAVTVTRWYVLEGHPRPPENLALTGLSLPGEIIRPGAPLKVRVEVSRFGGTGTVKAMPRVYLDGRLAGQGEVSLDPDGQAAASVELPPLEAGAFELSARLDADNLAVDNQRSMLLNIPPRLAVCLIEGNGRQGRWIRAALEVLDASGAVRLTVYETLPLDQKAFQGTGVFVLHGVDYPESAIVSFLDRAESAGAGTLVLPSGEGPAADMAVRRFGAAAARMGFSLAAGPLERLGGFDTPARPSAADGSGAVFSALFEALPGLEQVKINALRTLEDTGSDETVGRSWDLKTAGGRPLMRLCRGEQCNLILAAVDLADPAQTELPETPLFVPLAHSLISLCAWRGPVASPGLSVGEKAELFFGSPVNTGRMQVHGPGESRFMLPPGEHARIEFEGTNLPGVYRIFDGEKLTGAFDVALDSAESDVRLESRERIKQWFGGTEVRFIAPSDTLENVVFPDRGGVEAWPWLLGLFLLVLGAEQILANRKEE